MRNSTQMTKLREISDKFKKNKKAGKWKLRRREKESWKTDDKHDLAAPPFING